MNDPNAVLAVLANVPAVLTPLLHEIPDELRRRRPAPERWSAHEHACHLADAQAVLAERLARMLAEEHPQLVPHQPSPDQQRGAFLHQDLEEALERFTRERGEIVERLRQLAPEQWERTGDHPEYERYSVYTLARQLALHDLLHTSRIEELLQRRDWEAIAPAVSEVVPGAFAGARPGELKVLGPIAVPGLAPRSVRVYLPRGLFAGGARFALYLFDGQNVFGDETSFSGGWHVHEAVEGLARAGHPAPVVIGIDHGGEERISELSPFDFQGRPAKVDVLLAWMTGELMPALQQELGLLPGPLGAVVGGSSMGGLAALYAHFRHPEAFGGVMAMSPSVWIAERAIFGWIAAQPRPPVSRIYLDCGAREGRGMLLPMAVEMAAYLASCSQGEAPGPWRPDLKTLASRSHEDDRLFWRPDAKGAHNERSWRRRLPRALKFLYRKGEE